MQIRQFDFYSKLFKLKPEIARVVGLVDVKDWGGIYSAINSSRKINPAISEEDTVYAIEFIETYFPDIKKFKTAEGVSGGKLYREESWVQYKMAWTLVVGFFVIALSVIVFYNVASYFEVEISQTARDATNILLGSITTMVMLALGWMYNTSIGGNRMQRQIYEQKSDKKSE